jgi:hypothetical protein
MMIVPDRETSYPRERVAREHAPDPQHRAKHSNGSSQDASAVRPFVEAGQQRSRSAIEADPEARRLGKFVAGFIGSPAMPGTPLTS